MEEALKRMTKMRDDLFGECHSLSGSVPKEVADPLWEAYGNLYQFCIALRTHLSQEKFEKGEAIAPFPYEWRTEDTYRAKIDDVEEAVKAWCRENDREVPQYVDARAVKYWFEQLPVIWNGKTPEVFEEDSEESPWMVEWSRV